jgi:predicted transposase YbfD/YdcC
MLAPAVLTRRYNWPGLKSIVEVYSIRELKDKVEEEKRYYLASLQQEAKKLNHAIRQHWGIEHRLHHVLDISCRDDDSRISKRNAPENIAIIKYAALNLLQKSKKTGESIKALRKIAAWDENRLIDIFNKIL